MLEEDGGAVALEQDHRVVDEAGQDPIEVEPAADVARDAPERLGSMEEVRDLVGALGAADHRADGVRRDPGDVEVARTERAGGLADDVEDAPRLARTGDRHGQLGAAVGEDRQRVVRPALEQDARHRAASGPVPAGGQFERLAEDPEATGQVDQARRTGSARRRPRGVRAVRRGPPRPPRGDDRTHRGGRGPRH